MHKCQRQKERGIGVILKTRLFDEMPNAFPGVTTTAATSLTSSANIGGYSKDKLAQDSPAQ